MNDRKTFDLIAQFAIPFLTILSQIIISLKYPKYGLIVALTSQPFWLYSSWKSYKTAGQVGILINTVIMTILISAGVINYWFL